MATSLDPRARHLFQASKLFAKTQPKLSSYLGSQLAEYIEDLPETARPKNLNPSFCQACGSPQIPGLGCTVKLETTRPRPRRKKAGKAQKGLRQSTQVEAVSGKSGTKQVRGLVTSKLRITCDSCRRYVLAPLQKPGKVKAVAVTSSTVVRTKGKQQQQHDDAKPPTGSTGTGKVLSTSDFVTAATSPSAEKKARKKQKKGGLAAILAQSKSGAGGSSSSGSFTFMDLARKRYSAL